MSLTYEQIKKLGIQTSRNNGDEYITVDGRRWHYTGFNTWTLNVGNQYVTPWSLGSELQ